MRPFSSVTTRASAGVLSLVCAVVCGCGDDGGKLISDQRQQIEQLQSRVTELEGDVARYAKYNVELQAKLKLAGAAIPEASTVRAPSTTAAERFEVTVAKLLAKSSGFSEAPPQRLIREVAEAGIGNAGRTAVFDNVWISADVDFDNGVYKTHVQDDRKSLYGSMSDGILFAMPKTIADSLRERADADTSLKAKIYCHLESFEGYQGKPCVAAVIFRIDTYNRGGSLHSTITTTGAAKTTPAAK